uniref:Death domain-containing protein n=1 Tax=Branchiostoma floridae TaxID=7739 RepID=C3Y7Z6_BRAFL|eukprot:XP_002607641.1 hypothetical protein BRAFLDRAFT_84670 [Branchiostoma floridae]
MPDRQSRKQLSVLRKGVGRYFSFIKNKVSSDWKDLAWHLGFETPDIENIDGKHRDDKSRCMDLLQQWYKREGNAATIHVLMEALQDAELQHVVDSLNDKYPDLSVHLPLQEVKRKPFQDDEVDRPRKRFQANTDLPVQLNLGMVQQPTAAGGQDDDTYIRKRLIELERTLFTVDVLRDRGRYEETREIFLSHKALLKDAITGSFILFLAFLRQTDVDRFYHNHYRVGEGSLSQQLSHILISEHLQDKVKGAQLIVRLHVKHEDYVRVRDGLGQGLDRTTSVGNLLALPSPSRHVHRSSLRGLDLAVTGGEDQACTDRTDDITTLYRQVQSAVRTTREKSKQAKVLTGRQGDAQKMLKGTGAVKVLKEEDEKPQKLLLELKEKFQQLKETNKSKDARIKKFLAAEGTPGKKKDITMPYRQVQSTVQKTREKSKQVKVQLQMMQRKLLTSSQEVDALMKEVQMLKDKNEKAEKVFLQQKAEMNEKIQQLQETNKNMPLETMIEELLTAKQLVESVRLIRKGRSWVRKVSFGGEGSGRGEFTCPSGVVVSQDNEVYIADWGNTRIQMFTMDGVYVREFTTTLPGETGKKVKPWDVAVDRNDNLWVVGDDHVVQYSREGTCLVEIDLPFVETGRGITVSMATEQILVTEYDGKDGRLRVFDQDGSEMDTYGSGHRSPEPWWPCCVAVDGEGNILVTDSNNHCVHFLDREENFKFKFGSDKSQLKYPQGICVNGMGNIIVADIGNGCVKMFDSEGRFLCHIGSGMVSPYGVAVSPGGDVVVTDFKDHTVSVWTLPYMERLTQQ